MKRKLKWIAVVLVLLLLGFGAALFLLPRDPITLASWKQIRIGMTEEEVEDILGGPGISTKDFWDQNEALEKQMGKPPFIDAGVCLNEPERKAIGTDAIIGSAGGEGPVSKVRVAVEGVRVWFGRRGYMLIQFDNEGHVESKLFQARRPADPTFLDHLRDWLGL